MYNSRYELVDKYLVDLRSQIRNGDRHVFEILKKLWNDEFIVKSRNGENEFGLCILLMISESSGYSNGEYWGKY